MRGGGGGDQRLEIINKREGGEMGDERERRGKRNYFCLFFDFPFLKKETSRSFLSFR